MLELLYTKAFRRAFLDIPHILVAYCGNIEITIKTLQMSINGAHRMQYVLSVSAGEDEEYVPPKAEVSEIKEDDSLYSKRYSTYHP